MMLISACSGFLEEKSQDEVLVRTVQDYDELLLGYMPQFQRLSHVIRLRR